MVFVDNFSNFVRCISPSVHKNGKEEKTNLGKRINEHKFRKIEVILAIFSFFTEYPKKGKSD